MEQLIKHSNPTIKKKDLENVLKCLISDEIAHGDIVSDFEKKLLEYLGCKYGIATASCESSLHLVFKVLDIDFGDEIILPSYYFTPALDVINYVNATPVFCDIEENSYNISLESVKSKITEKTKAIIVPHMFGLPVDVEPFLELDIPIIEDCGHSLGASVGENKVGNFGDFAIFSFYATRMITTGQGGFLACKKKKDLELLRDLINFDERDDYKVRYSYKLSDMQAALGLKQIDLLDYFINLRREIGNIFNQKLMEAKRDVPKDFPERKNIYYRYPVKVGIPTKDAIELYKKHNIEAKRPVYKPLHQYFSMEKSDFPNTEEAFKTTISVPIYPTLKKSQVDTISKILPKI